MTTGTSDPHVADDILNRSHSRRDLARFAAGFGMGAAAILGRPALASAALPGSARTERMRTGLPRTPEAFFPAMEERFNSLDVATALELFRDDAVFIDGNGVVHHGKVAIGRQLKTFFDTGLKMTLTPRHIFASGDAALSINDWSYDGTARDGAAIKVSGSTSDVLRRSADGVWRYVIDNPFGTVVGGTR